MPKVVISINCSKAMDKKKFLKITNIIRSDKTQSTPDPKLNNLPLELKN